jgi:hypothetical protein
MTGSDMRPERLLELLRELRAWYLV